MASGSGDGAGKVPDLPRGLVDRRGAPAGKAARLPSLRGPRDLTLGGVPKKVFAPKIPVRREKSTTREENKDQTNSGQRSEKDKPHKGGHGKGRGRDGGRGRGRGRGRGEENLIQIHSLFEQGPSASQNKGWGRDYDGGGGGSGGGGFGGRGGGGGGGGKAGAGPRVKAEGGRLGTEKSSHTLDTLMRDNFLADSPAEDPNLLPVMMPMYTSIKSEAKKEELEPLSEDSGVKVNIKPEPGSPTTATGSSIGGHSTPDIQQDLLTCAQLLKRATQSDKEEMVFIQLPTALPGIPATVEEDVTPPDAAGKEDNKQKTKPAKCSLKDFSEGYLGKLRVRKSGKTELVLGNIVLDVSMGVPASFLQEVVSVRTDEGNGHMTMLGQVKQKMIVTPDFEALLKAKSAENA